MKFSFLKDNLGFATNMAHLRTTLMFTLQYFVFFMVIFVLFIPILVPEVMIPISDLLADLIGDFKLASTILLYLFWFIILVLALISHVIGKIKQNFTHYTISNVAIQTSVSRGILKISQETKTVPYNKITTINIWNGPLINNTIPTKKASKFSYLGIFMVLLGLYEIEIITKDNTTIKLQGFSKEAAQDFLTIKQNIGI